VCKSFALVQGVALKGSTAWLAAEVAWMAILGSSSSRLGRMPVSTRGICCGCKLALRPVLLVTALPVSTPIGAAMATAAADTSIRHAV